jgi:hypothetical protein
MITDYLPKIVLGLKNYLASASPAPIISIGTDEPLRISLASLFLLQSEFDMSQFNPV